MLFKDVSQKLLHEVLQKTKKIADVGIELEIEGHGLPHEAPHWQVKSEGSLQDGLEYITKPIKADAVEAYVTNLAKFFKDLGATVKPSYRCSTHVHVNMMSEKVADVLGMYVIFTMFEPVVLSLCGNQRNGNLFCMSTYETGEVVESFNKLCQAFERWDVDSFRYGRGKYSTFNADRLQDLGTLEARCFPLSIDGKEVSEWVSWLMNMRDLAISQPDKTYRELWKNIRQSPLWYAMKIFGPSINKVPDLPDLMDLGTETAYELTKVLKKWYASEQKSRSARKKLSRYGLAPSPEALAEAALQAAIIDDYTET